MDQATNVLEKVLLETIKEQRRSRRWKIFFRVSWLLLVIGVLITLVVNHKTSQLAGRHIAVVDLKGVISEDNNTYETLSDGLKAALEDKDTVAVFIRANSPGGSPVYSDMLYNQIIRLRAKYPKVPIYVVVEDVCASGCYYIASAANDIYASKASIIGSIGVIYTGIGVTGLMQKLGIDSRLLISGKNKAMGYPLVPLNLQQQAMQQTMLDEIHNQFINAVKIGRGNRLTKNDPDLFSGRYWIGEDAKPIGLIDGFGTVDSIAYDKFHLDKIINFTPDQEPFDKLAKKFGVELLDSFKGSVGLDKLGGYR